MLNECRAGYNLLFYGVGSKKRLLEAFVRERAAAHPHVVVNGYSPSFSVRDVRDADEHAAGARCDNACCMFNPREVFAHDCRSCIGNGGGDQRSVRTVQGDLQGNVPHNGACSKDGAGIISGAMHSAVLHSFIASIVCCCSFH